MCNKSATLFYKSNVLNIIFNILFSFKAFYVLIEYENFMNETVIVVVVMDLE